MIDICLATYNGELYLREQLDSIINQTFRKWHLYIRDDGSSDNTISIIRDYKKKHKDKISIISDRKGRLGFIQNFNEILEYTKENYVAFCDQDDIWAPEKLEMQFSLMRKEESKSKDGILIYTDFSYIDKNNNIVCSSFYKKRKKNHKKDNSKIISAIFFGIAVGCTLLFNRKILKLSENIPNKFILGHDRWILYIALLNGRLCFLDKVTVLHRIHANNVGGKKIKKLKDRNIGNIINFNMIYKRVNAAYLLLNRQRTICSKKSSNKDIYLLRELSNLNNMSLVKRSKFFIKSNLFTKNYLLSIYLYVNIILYNKF